MRNRSRLGLALPVALVTLGACAHAPQPKSAFPTADDAIARMKATYACAYGVQGDAKIDTFSPRGKVRGTLYPLLVIPDRVRFDIVSPFGAALFTLTSDGDKFQLLDWMQKQFLYGPASPCNLGRLTQVPIPSFALVDLLRGEAPILVHKGDGASIAWDAGGYYRVELKSTRNAAEELHLEVRAEDKDKPWSQQRLNVTLVRVTQGGLDLYRADLSDHKALKRAEARVDPDGLDAPIEPIGPACDAELPHRIRMRVPNTDEDVIFDYKDARWNPPVLGGSFAQTPPSGVHAGFVDCGK